MQLSNPWFDQSYRVAQSRLFLAALRVRKQFLYENRTHLRTAASVWNQQEKYLEQKSVIEAAWNWINLAIPVISSTFASFSRMCRNLGTETLGHLFIDEAGQALPQAAVGAIYRSRHVMVVGDPSQIKFTISNVISYDGYMVQGVEKNGKTGWFDVRGKANNKYVAEQGDFLVRKIQELMEQNPKIGDKKEKDVIYVITPFSNVARQLAKRLKEIHFIRYDDQDKPTNVGTVHTFQGKEAPVVFFVLGADQQSSGAARWAVSEPNMMNVAATRAKEAFYIIGDKARK